MSISELINNPNLMDRDTLYELRSLLALYPYFQTARLLMLQNLYLLHDPTFDEELRRSAIYITDRKVIFNLIEAAHYRLNTIAEGQQTTAAGAGKGERTLKLIDNFLQSIPQKDEDEDERKKARREPTPTDATVDYVAYLMESEKEKEEDDTPQLKGHTLIDSFIDKNENKIELSGMPQTPTQETKASSTDTMPEDESYFTETLARIYVKQKKYDKALEIIKRLSLNYPEKNAYFADQIRFLEKLVLIDTHKKNAGNGQ